MAARDMVSSLQREVELAKEGLKNVDENIKKLTGRDPSEGRGPVGNKRIVVKRNIGERIGGPPQKRFNPGNAYNRLGPRGNSDRNNRRSLQLESDGEEEEDDSKKPALQSSIVATSVPSREQQEVKTDKKTQTRNKRMFGVLLGTLQKFKENSTKEAARERKRKQIEKKLEEAAVEEREQAIRKKKELFVARREKQAKLEELERKIEVAEMLEEWEDHDKKLSKFIRTDTKPHIFYLPAKHNDYTKGLLEKTAEHVEDAIKKRRQEVSEVLHKPEDDARVDDQREAGDDSLMHEDNEEADLKQGVEHSDDERSGRKRVVKERRRRVILTSRRNESETKDDEIRKTNEEEKSQKDKVEVDEDLERNEGNEVDVKVEEKEVEVRRVDSNIEVEEMPDEVKERNVVMSEVNEEKITGEESEVKEKEVEEEEAKVQEISEERNIQEEVTQSMVVDRDREGQPAMDGDNSESTTAANKVQDLPPSSNEKEIKEIDDGTAQTADVRKAENQPENDSEQSKTESNMEVDPGQNDDVVVG